MRDYFDTAYEYFCDALASFADIAKLMVGFLVMITIPIWIMPYLIIRRRRKERQ